MLPPAVPSEGLGPMPEPVPISAIASYHAHVYVEDAEARARAALLRERIAARFLVQMGRWHERPVGPHPLPMYQVAFEARLFAHLVPWLMLNRMGLTLFIHPNTDRPRDDHLVHALWLGAVMPLDASMLDESLAALGRRPDPVLPNTTPTQPLL